MQCQLKIILGPQARRATRVLRPKTNKSLRSLRQSFRSFQSNYKRMRLRWRQETRNHSKLHTLPLHLGLVLAHGMNHLPTNKQTIARLHLRRNCLPHVAALVKRPLIAPRNKSRRAIILCEIRKCKEEVDLRLRAVGPELCIRRVRRQVAVQDLPRLGAQGIQRRSRRQPVIAIMSSFGKGAPADGVDEVVFEDELAERRAVVDYVAGALGLCAVEGCEVWMRHSRAPLDGFQAGFEFVGNLVCLCFCEHVL